MTKKLILDEYEQDIDNNFENLNPVENMQEEITMLTEAAKTHIKRKKSITLRIQEDDLNIIRTKAAKLGIPYQTYINMIIHKEATRGIKYAV